MRLGLNTALAADRMGDRSLPCLARRHLGSYFSAPDVPGRVITTLGRSSLFVYWIHVEMAYGAIALPLRRSMPLELSLLGTVLLCALLYQIVRWKDRKLQGVELKGPIRILSPVLDESVWPAALGAGVAVADPAAKAAGHKSRTSQNASKYVIFAMTAREISAPLRESCRSL